MSRIPFNRARLTGKELEYIQEAIGRGHISGDGPFTQKCQSILEQLLGVPKVLLTTSCTHALEMTSLLLGVGEGDEVIVPSFTFVSTINAFVLRGARPVFADVRPDTLNLDERQLEKHITPRTKAIVAVHYSGVGCEMGPIMEISRRTGVPVVEDNAHGLFGSYQGRNLGTFGPLATLSFHETKNITCGEGGALLINDARYVERAEIIREKGTDRTRFFRGLTDRYTWIDVGSSYLPSEILSAFLYAQLESREEIQLQRRRVWEFYHKRLKSWAPAHGVRLPDVPPHCNSAYHMFYLLMPSLEARDALILHLKSQGIHSVFHYLPLHLSQMGRRFGGNPGDCPVSEGVSDRIVRLPFYNDLTEKDQQRVVMAVQGCALTV